MRKWVADLHVHTLLSPCAAVEMTPRNIVMNAAQNGINLIAVTDHNVSGNVMAALRAGAHYDVKVWPGIEVETKEGGHVVALFDSLAKLCAFQNIIDDNMLPVKNDIDKFGRQFIVDEEDNFVTEEERLLLTSIELDVHRIVLHVEQLGGVCIAAHIDRPAYSLLSYLGFIPASSGLAAVEISRNSLRELTEKKLACRVGNLPYVTNSDSHSIEAFLTGPKNHIYMKEATIKEFKLALLGREGRFIKAGQQINNSRLF